MAFLDLEAQRAALLDHTERLADLVREADRDTPIPTCPGWTLTELLIHLGGGHHWAATMIAERATTRLSRAATPHRTPPADPDEADNWLRRSAETVLDAVDATGSDVPIWTPIGPPLPARWWIRRRLHEATVHGADAALALGREVDLEPELAADGLSEALEILRTALVFTARSTSGDSTPALGGGEILSLYATDDGLKHPRAWTIRPNGDTIQWNHDPGPGTVTVRGSVVALFLTMLRRIPVDTARLDITGDRDVLTQWLERTVF
ncbi:maleylpyruvate isomerase family mycothiol-dependent enzyme [Nocardia sp. NBC_01503]|uniref:maleylpyruvate isomerase family mycothiol-dependent enzyme n=1 Tax=Nocardia sp. NBC_01503 TaxID=2975997 RepID=UPI002E7B6C6C|nr:maleylpyruvate isomerase family mycothiol-dependent enzyme [Nocardia sp. NBC_01503]WTL30995.1 maleylpyruvate isomerase family mycothiol-dependent enzyme [Nocardia sp. NBC_01503]